jgi:hypothetical protein
LFEGSNMPWKAFIPNFFPPPQNPDPRTTLAVSTHLVGKPNPNSTI